MVALNAVPVEAQHAGPSSRQKTAGRSQSIVLRFDGWQMMRHSTGVDAPHRGSGGITRKALYDDPDRTISQSRFVHREYSKVMA